MCYVFWTKRTIKRTSNRVIETEDDQHLRRKGHFVQIKRITWHSANWFLYPAAIRYHNRSIILVAAPDAFPLLLMIGINTCIPYDRIKWIEWKRIQVHSSYRMEKLMVEHPILVYHHILITAARSVIDVFPWLSNESLCILPYLH